MAAAPRKNTRSASGTGKRTASRSGSGPSAGTRRSGTAKRSSGTAARRSTAGRSSGNVRKRAAGKNNESFTRDLGVILLFAGMIFLFLSNFGLMGSVGAFCSDILFGVFGWIAYCLPILVFVFVIYMLFAKDPGRYGCQIAAIGILLVLAGILAALLHNGPEAGSVYSASALYEEAAADHAGGGVLFGSIAYGLYDLFRMIGTVLVMIVLFIIAMLLLTGGSLLELLSTSAGKMERYHTAAVRERQLRRQERYDSRADSYEDDYDDGSDGYYDDGYGEGDDGYYEEEYDEGSLTRPVMDTFLSRKDRNRRLHEERENDRILNGSRRIRGVAIQTLIPEEEVAAAEEMPEAAEYDIPEPVPAAEEMAEEEVPVYESSDLHELIGEEPVPDAVVKPVRISDPEEERVLTPATEIVIHRETEQAEPVLPEPAIPAPAAPAGFPVHEIPQTESAAFRTPEPAVAEIVTDTAEPSPAVSEPEAAVPAPQPVSGTAVPLPAEPVRDAAPSVLSAASAADAADIEVHRDRGTDARTDAASPAPAAAPVRHAAKERAPYVFPDIALLRRSKRVNDADTDRELKETALQLEDTLRTFGVNVTITDISQGPAVTRYELLPEQGVKVSRILSLQDDIKMHLAATDIRIEAPIPGKAAIGIEVPNKENQIVTLRDVIETPEYQNFKGKLAFPVGKDIGGKAVIFDIAKMPHVLIAGATGSGKSVCINTIIMGLLYKTTPEECKLIMIDPKIVELSVYNGIPHLMIPVVTDPKKAAAALAWAVAEMTERYGKFAEAKVRDLKGYNEKMRQLKESGEDPEARPIPQLVIIVDELADLMMVSANEVEEAICRLAQLARAAGIHLIIATQRPSVDVITGLIKANMPSRVAFAVSSGVDSRTILDMVGAEKLLGKGDMLFYPQGYPKPARVQGAFVTDEEVSDVVNYIREKNRQYESDEEVGSRIESFEKGAPGMAPAGQGGGGSANDELFADAGRFIIEKQKASIGLLQRAFKIGFNRAARIMDQLADAGVVSEEEGTKARNILMDMIQFEQYLEENG